MASVIGALLFGCVGLGLLGYVIYALCGSFLGDGPALIDRWRLRRKFSLLKAADLLLAGDPPRAQTAAALASLEACFCLEYLFQHPRSFEQLEDLHEAILDRVIRIAERSGVRLSALPELEDLLKAHTDMLKEYSETQAARREILKRRNQKGKDTPGWALSEFDKKLSLLGAQIVKNQKDAAEVIRVVFRSLRDPQARAEQVYH